MLRAEEVELLVCGNPSLDMRELRRVAEYDGYTAESDTIRYSVAVPHGGREGAGGTTPQSWLGPKFSRTLDTLWSSIYSQ